MLEESLGNLFSRLIFDTHGAMANAAAFDSQLVGMSTRLDSFSNSLTSAGLKAKFLIGLPLGLIGGRAIKEFIDFEEQMRNVNSIARESEEQLKRTSAAVVNLAQDVGRNPIELAKALYEINSSGFMGAQALEVLKQSAISARAGLAQTKEAAKSLVAVLNAYSIDASRASDISDIFFKTIEKGIVTFPEMARHMGTALASAASARIPFEELGAAIVTMTRAGVEVPESFTAINRAILRITKGNDELNKVFAQYPERTGAMMLANRGLAGTMEVLMKHTGGSVAAFQRLGFYVRDLRAVLSLARRSGLDFAQAIQWLTDTNSRAGATARAFEEQTKSLRVQWDKTKATLSAVAIDFVQEFAPALRDVMTSIQGMARAFQDLSRASKIVMSSLAGFLVVLPPALLLLGLMGNGISMVASAFGKLGVASKVAGKATADGLKVAAAEAGRTTRVFDALLGKGKLLPILGAAGAGFLLMNRATDGFKESPKKAGYGSYDPKRPSKQSGVSPTTERNPILDSLSGMDDLEASIRNMSLGSRKDSLDLRNAIPVSTPGSTEVVNSKEEHGFSRMADYLNQYRLSQEGSFESLTAFARLQGRVNTDASAASDALFKESVVSQQKLNGILRNGQPEPDVQVAASIHDLSRTLEGVENPYANMGKWVGMGAGGEGGTPSSYSLPIIGAVGAAGLLGAYPLVRLLRSHLGGDQGGRITRPEMRKPTSFQLIQSRLLEANEASKRVGIVQEQATRFGFPQSTVDRLGREQRQVVNRASARWAASPPSAPPVTPPKVPFSATRPSIASEFPLQPGVGFLLMNRATDGFKESPKKAGYGSYDPKRPSKQSGVSPTTERNPILDSLSGMDDLEASIRNMSLGSRKDSLDLRNAIPVSTPGSTEVVNSKEEHGFSRMADYFNQYRLSQRDSFESLTAFARLQGRVNTDASAASDALFKESVVSQQKLNGLLRDGQPEPDVQVAASIHDLSRTLEGIENPYANMGKWAGMGAGGEGGTPSSYSLPIIGGIGAAGLLGAYPLIRLLRSHFGGDQGGRITRSGMQKPTAFQLTQSRLLEAHEASKRVGTIQEQATRFGFPQDTVDRLGREQRQVASRASARWAASSPSAPPVTPPKVPFKATRPSIASDFPLRPGVGIGREQLLQRVVQSSEDARRMWREVKQSSVAVAELNAKAAKAQRELALFPERIAQQGSLVQQRLAEEATARRAYQTVSMQAGRATAAFEAKPRAGSAQFISMGERLLEKQREQLIKETQKLTSVQERLVRVRDTSKARISSLIEKRAVKAAKVSEYDLSLKLLRDDLRKKASSLSSSRTSIQSVQARIASIELRREAASGWVSKYGRMIDRQKGLVQGAKADVTSQQIVVKTLKGRISSLEKAVRGIGSDIVSANRMQVLASEKIAAKSRFEVAKRATEAARGSLSRTVAAFPEKQRIAAELTSAATLQRGVVAEARAKALSAIETPAKLRASAPPVTPPKVPFSATRPSIASEFPLQPGVGIGREQLLQRVVQSSEEAKRMWTEVKQSSVAVAELNAQAAKAQRELALFPERIAQQGSLVQQRIAEEATARRAYQTASMQAGRATAAFEAKPRVASAQFASVGERLLEKQREQLIKETQKLTSVQERLVRVRDTSKAQISSLIEKRAVKAAKVSEYDLTLKLLRDDFRKRATSFTTTSSALQKAQSRIASTELRRESASSWVAQYGRMIDRQKGLVQGAKADVIGQQVVVKTLKERMSSLEKAVKGMRTDLAAGNRMQVLSSEKIAAKSRFEMAKRATAAAKTDFAKTVTAFSEKKLATEELTRLATLQRGVVAEARAKALSAIETPAKLRALDRAALIAETGIEPATTLEQAARLRPTVRAMAWGQRFGSNLERITPPGIANVFANARPEISQIGPPTLVRSSTKAFAEEMARSYAKKAGLEGARKGIGSYLTRLADFSKQGKLAPGTRPDLMKSLDWSLFGARAAREEGLIKAGKRFPGLRARFAGPVGKTAGYVLGQAMNVDLAADAAQTARRVSTPDWMRFYYGDEAVGISEFKYEEPKYGFWKNLGVGAVGLARDPIMGLASLFTGDSYMRYKDTEDDTFRRSWTAEGFSKAARSLWDRANPAAPFELRYRSPLEERAFFQGRTRTGEDDALRIEDYQSQIAAISRVIEEQQRVITRELEKPESLQNKMLLVEAQIAQEQAKASLARMRLSRRKKIMAIPKDVPETPLDNAFVSDGGFGDPFLAMSGGGFAGNKPNLWERVNKYGVASLVNPVIGPAPFTVGGTDTNERMREIEKSLSMSNRRLERLTAKKSELQIESVQESFDTYEKGFADLEKENKRISWQRELEAIGSPLSGIINGMEKIREAFREDQKKIQDIESELGPILKNLADQKHPQEQIDKMSKAAFERARLALEASREAERGVLGQYQSRAYRQLRGDQLQFFGTPEEQSRFQLQGQRDDVLRSIEDEKKLRVSIIEDQLKALNQEKETGLSARSTTADTLQTRIAKISDPFDKQIQAAKDKFALFVSDLPTKEKLDLGPGVEITEEEKQRRIEFNKGIDAQYEAEKKRHDAHVRAIETEKQRRIRAYRVAIDAFKNMSQNVFDVQQSNIEANIERLKSELEQVEREAEEKKQRADLASKRRSDAITRQQRMQFLSLPMMGSPFQNQMAGMREQYIQAFEMLPGVSPEQRKDIDARIKTLQRRMRVAQIELNFSIFEASYLPGQLEEAVVKRDELQQRLQGRVPLSGEEELNALGSLATVEGSIQQNALSVDSVSTRLSQNQRAMRELVALQESVSAQDWNIRYSDRFSQITAEIQRDTENLEALRQEREQLRLEQESLSGRIVENDEVRRLTQNIEALDSKIQKLRNTLGSLSDVPSLQATITEYQEAIDALEADKILTPRQRALMNRWNKVVVPKMQRDRALELAQLPGMLDESTLAKLQLRQQFETAIMGTRAENKPVLLAAYKNALGQLEYQEALGKAASAPSLTYGDYDEYVFRKKSERMEEMGYGVSATTAPRNQIEEKQLKALEAAQRYLSKIAESTLDRTPPAVFQF